MLFVAREVDYARYLLEFERTIDSRIASYRIVSYCKRAQITYFYYFIYLFYRYTS